MTDISKIVSALIGRTEDGTLKWKPGELSDEFTVSINAISVELRRLEPDTFASHERHRLAIRNDAGATVTALETFGEFEFVPNDQLATHEQAQDLSRLFALARRSALNIQATLEELAKALDAE